MPKSTTVAARVTNTTADLLKIAAEERGVTRSRYIARAAREAALRDLGNGGPHVADVGSGREEEQRAKVPA